MGLKVFALSVLLVGTHAVLQLQQQTVTANPIRRVVTMLQRMQQQVTNEGKQQEEAYDKFMCYCKSNGGDLGKSIQNAKQQIEELTASIASGTERKEQIEASLKEHQVSRDEAKDTVAKATALRKKEAATFAKTSSDLETNLAALEKAIPAIERGMAGSFLQTTAASMVRRFVMEKADLPDTSRDELLAFLSGAHTQGYVPQSGEIVGILKTIHDEMTAALGDATEEESNAIKNFNALVAAKSREIETLQKQIEQEMTRGGDLGTRLAGQKNDLEDTQQSLSDDERFKMNLEESCATKTQLWEEMQATRQQELLALAETIKVLNDDDALELFKKTLPSAAMSLVQVRVTRAGQMALASSLVAKARLAARTGQFGEQPQLDLLALALQGKKIGFEKVIAMIDELVVNLKKEQQDDDHKKEYCDFSFDKSDDKRKVLENSVSDSETAVAEMTGYIGELVEQIAELEAGIKALDKSVADATELRKEQNVEFKQLISDDSTAKELLLFAKNRLNKFYNPKLHKPAAQRELSSEERVVKNFGGEVLTPAPGGIADTGIGAVLVQVSAHLQYKDAPPPPPATFDAYAKKTQEGHGVIAMIDLLLADLDKEMQEAKVDEKNAQGEYEVMMKESAAKRAADSKSISDKSSEKASTEESLQDEQDTLAATTREHMQNARFIASLHGECDFLLRYYDVRKQARAGEIESLMAAKATLSGADYS